jgi:hypothetical protein
MGINVWGCVIAFRDFNGDQGSLIYSLSQGLLIGLEQDKQKEVAGPGLGSNDNHLRNSTSQSLFSAGADHPPLSLVLIPVYFIRDASLNMVAQVPKGA